MKTQEQGDRIEDAKRVLRVGYYADVQSVADDLKDQIDNGDFDNREQFLDLLHDTIDGHERVILTNKAMWGVLLSEQDCNLAIEEFGADSFHFSEGIPWSQLMYSIFERDVMEALDTMGVDVNDPILEPDKGGE